uniref:Uncharacterized protein n=1 Tax=Leviviridae sp. TaxID=2027243 RepID=A0A514D900_9VIRU|nr:MAG: hypothetical protein H1Bulk30557_000002 [Leviviridae sp.]
MAFTDPIAISDDGVSRNLARTGTTALESTYRLEDGSGNIHTLTLSHNFGGTKGGSSRRALMRYSREYFVTDPLVTGQSQRIAVSATLTMSWPAIVTAADAAKRGVTIATLASAANLLKVAGGET